MKTKVTIAALVVTAIAVYFIKRRSQKEEEYVPVKKTHHLTDAFSKARRHRRGLKDDDRWMTDYIYIISEGVIGMIGQKIKFDPIRGRG